MAFRDLITVDPPAPGALDWATTLNAYLDAVEAALENYIPEGVVIVVSHGSTAGTARPAGAASVLWLGTVEPTNMVAASDIWLGPA